MGEISKRDWKLFREKLPGWQERYMERLCKEYVELLLGGGKGSEKFWALEKRIKDDRKSPGVIVSVSRSNMIYDVLGLLRDGAITMNDLEDFTEDFQGQIKFMIERW